MQRPGNGLSERAEKVSSATQDQIRDLQQGGRYHEEAKKKVQSGEQERPRYGQGAEEHADPRGGEDQARRLLRAEPEERESELLN